MNMTEAMRVLPPWACATLVMAMSAAPVAAQQVTVERDSPLYAEPRLEAAQTAQLKQGATGEVVGKQGGWLNLRTPAASGWLFSFNVRFPPRKAGSGEPGTDSALGQVFGPRRTVSVTSQIGIRGLDEEDLRQASFNAGEMKLLDDYAVSKPVAEDGASAAGLVPVRLDYLDAKP